MHNIVNRPRGDPLSVAREVLLAPDLAEIDQLEHAIQLLSIDGEPEDLASFVQLIQALGWQHHHVEPARSAAIALINPENSEKLIVSDDLLRIRAMGLVVGLFF